MIIISCLLRLVLGLRTPKETSRALFRKFFQKSFVDSCKALIFMNMQKKKILHSALKMAVRSAESTVLGKSDQPVGTGPSGL
jgi:hypothetical protein